jgi:alkane 1-monooxygenase
MPHAFRVIPFLAPYFVLALAWAGATLSGGYVLAAAVFVLVLHPLLDLLFGRETPSEHPTPGPAWLHDLLLWGYIPAQMALLVVCLAQPLDPSSLEFWGLALSLGVTTGGMGITIGHELIHRTRFFERILGTLLYLQVNYGHFEVEHTLGHHVWVGTPKDPATARSGQSLFAFLPQTLIGSLKSAWKLLFYITVQSLLCLLVVSTLGIPALLLYLLQSLVAVLMLETINYVEHYGLTRNEVRPDVYERVTEAHSWNSLHRMTNWFLFNLGRHAEHHAHPRVPYQKLKATPRPRTLPFGYSAMLILAWLPPIWRKIFHGGGPQHPGHLTRTA